MLLKEDSSAEQMFSPTGRLLEGGRERQAYRTGMGQALQPTLQKGRTTQGSRKHCQYS